MPSATQNPFTAVLQNIHAIQAKTGLLPTSMSISPAFCAELRLATVELTQFRPETEFKIPKTPDEITVCGVRAKVDPNLLINAILHYEFPVAIPLPE